MLTPERFPATVLSWGAFLSGVVTFLVFFTARNYQFVALDDYAYVVNNQHISNLDWNTVRWALTAFHEGNWHPLTLLSLAVDRYFWGLDPFGYHLTNTLLHSFTVLIAGHLFSVLLSAAFKLQPEVGRRQPGIVVGSIIGALVFGLHPLRVESVVWISERKDVLCLFFMASAIWWYLRYAYQSRREESVPFWQYTSYWLALGLTGLALMSKSAAVSMPLILCIIDWYPLGRRSVRGGFVRSQVDKIPFVMFSVVISVLALSSQQRATKVFDELDLLSRILVACKALLFYLAKTFWPFDLGPFYGHPGNVATTAPWHYWPYVFIVAGLVLAVILIGRRRRLWPALFCYYVVTIAPMLGLIQVGGQWAADRYSYLPALGLSLLWAGGTCWLVNRLDSARAARVSMVGLTLILCQLVLFCVLTVRQIPIWSTTETLTSRIIDLYPHRYGEVYYVRAVHRNRDGLYQLALEDIGEAMRSALQQNRHEVVSKIAFMEARVLKNMGRLPEAMAMADWAVQVSIAPPSAEEVALHEELQMWFYRQKNSRKP